MEIKKTGKRGRIEMILVVLMLKRVKSGRRRVSPPWSPHRGGREEGQRKKWTLKPTAGMNSFEKDLSLMINARL